MNRDQAVAAVRAAAVKVLSVSEDAVEESTNFADDLDADSLDLTEMVMVLEDDLGVDIGDRDLSDIRTVADAVDLLLDVAAATAA